MIKAIFLDWFQTLAHYQPPREEMQAQAFQAAGIQISPEQVKRGLLVADTEFFEENIKSPISKRSPEEQTKIYARYEEKILAGAGVSFSASADVILRILRQVQQQAKNLKFVLYNDVLPTLKKLKEQSYTIGLLTNLDRDMSPLCQELGIDAYVDFTVTSAEVGDDKPKPEIFLTALKRANVKASEAIHVGDQYKLDIMGARNAGIIPILIDRDGIYPGVTDCLKIQSLDELPGVL